MRKRSLFLSLTGALALVSLLLLNAPVQASFLSGFEGFSVLGHDGGGIQAPLDDSTVSFAVWQREGVDWTQDSPFSSLSLTNLSGAFGGASIDTDAKYVYLYQVINTNPYNPQQGTADSALNQFFVAYGPTPASNPYTSGGAIADTVFQNASTAISPVEGPTVPPNSLWYDGTPSGFRTVTPFAANTNALEPGSTTNALLMRNDNPAAYDYSVYFSFASDSRIPTDGTSSLMFLTSDYAPDFSWARTKASGGLNADGDVAAALVPIPGAVWLLASGLVGLVGLRRRFQN